MLITIVDDQDSLVEAAARRAVRGLLLFSQMWYKQISTYSTTTCRAHHAWRAITKNLVGCLQVTEYEYTGMMSEGLRVAKTRPAAPFAEAPH